MSAVNTLIDPNRALATRQNRPLQVPKSPKIEFDDFFPNVAQVVQNFGQGIQDAIGGIGQGIRNFFGLQNVSSGPAEAVTNAQSEALDAIDDSNRLNEEASNTFNRHIESLAERIDAVPIFEPSFNLRADPLFQQLEASVANSLANPDVINDATQAALFGRVEDQLRSTASETNRLLREDAARRGTAGSGASLALQQRSGETLGRDLAAAKRDIGIERALLRRESELAAQQAASAITGQVAQAGIARDQLRAGANALQLQRELASTGLLSQLEQFVPDVISKPFLQLAFEQADEAATEEERLANREFWSSFFSGITGIGAAFLIGD